MYCNLKGYAIRNYMTRNEKINLADYNNCGMQYMNNGKVDRNKKKSSLHEGISNKKCTEL